MSDNQYISFIKDLRSVSKVNGASFCRARKIEIDEAISKKQIMLQEINKYEDKHPTKLLPASYSLDSYSPEIYINELKDIHSQFFNCNNIVKIVIEKCDHLEGIKKIIEHYLSFMVELNFESIINSLRKINIIEKDVEESLCSTILLKKKATNIKKKLLLISAKFLLFKQKYKNIYKLLEIGRNYLLKWYNDLIKSNLYIEKKMFCDAYKMISENVNNLKKLNSSLYRLIIFEIISKKSNDKLITLRKICDNLLNNIFLNQNENYKDLFLYNVFLLNTDEFLNKSLFTFKNIIFKLIKDTFFSFFEDKIVCNKEDIKKIDDFQKYFVKIEENKFIYSIHQTLANIGKVCENFYFYLELHKTMKFISLDEKSKNEKYLYALENNKMKFFEKIEKKLSKLYKKLLDIIRNLNYKNLLYFVVFNSVFLDYIFSIFSIDTSKYFKNQIKICIKDNIKHQNIQLIKNVLTLLENDSWKRVPVSDTKLFDEDKVKDIANFPLRMFMNIFNNKENIINKSTSKIYFTKFFYEWSPISSNILTLLDNNLSKDFNILVFSKPLDFKSLILSTSSVNLIISMKHFLVYLNCFDSIIYDTFIQLFNTFDYYILSSILMIVKKPYMQMLLQEINIDDLRKKSNNQSNKLEAYVESVLFQTTYLSIKSFILKAKKNIECLFETEIDVFQQNSPVFPKLNKQIFINEQNCYSLMIENIIIIESFYSIYKVLKRFGCFIEKMDSDLQKKIIKDELTKYKKLLKDLSTFVFKPICYNIFKIDLYSKVMKIKWDMKENDSANQMHEANLFVDLILEEIQEKYEKLDFLSSGSITKSSKEKFLIVMISYFKDKLMDSFSKLKTCSSTGRSIMLKDVKFLKSRLETKFNIDISSTIRELEMYINSWYSDEDQFIQYILEQQLNYRHMNSIINTGNVFSKLDKQAKKNLMTSVEDTYLCLVENLMKTIK